MFSLCIFNIKCLRSCTQDTLLFCRLSEEIVQGEIVEELNLQELIEAVRSSLDQTGTISFFLFAQILL